MPSDGEMRRLSEDPALSTWLRTALITALDRDPVDAANDAAVLSLVLNRRASDISASLLAQLVVSKAKKKGAPGAG